MNQVKMLKVNQVARYLQMNRMTIYKLAKTGSLPGVKIGSEWRFNKDELLSWLKVHPEIEETQGKISKKKLKGRVLIVDDDPGIRELFIKFLKDDGQKAYMASSSKECMGLVKKYNPNVVLLDLKMADIDGIDTLQLIKRYNKKIAVIIITAYATMNTAIEAMKLGAYDYIAKPFDNDKIISLVRKAIKTTK